jgi:hypothetical protein
LELNFSKDLVQNEGFFWPEAKGKIPHAWREITSVNNHSIEIIAKESNLSQVSFAIFYQFSGFKGRI